VIPSAKDKDRWERRMMGRREDGQGQFFYAFDLDKVVPPDHLVRQIEGVLDLSWVHKSWPLTTHTQVGLRLIRCS
jgi:hypothetical protein